ncbi:hypothetical protein CPA50_18355 [Marinobacter sp. ANT_B65]|nr:hypothetical protein CPA50_18355 [Marinobacter sp. ANT_B65]
MFCKLSAKSRWRQSLLCFSGGLVMAFILASARAARNIFKKRTTRMAARRKTRLPSDSESPDW